MLARIVRNETKDIVATILILFCLATHQFKIQFGLDVVVAFQTIDKKNGKKRFR